MPEVNEWEVQGEIIKCSDTLLEKGVDPLEIAAAHMVHAMKIYRTVMDLDEYRKHIEFILNHDDPEPFQPLRMH
jgi:hypothetical protein